MKVMRRYYLPQLFHRQASIHHPTGVMGLCHLKVQAIPVDDQLHIIRFAQRTTFILAGCREKSFQRGLLSLPKGIQHSIAVCNV